MAVTPFDASDHALLLDGEWVTSDAWIDVTSPYSGDVVGRVPRVGAAETTRALDAAARVLAPGGLALVATEDPAGAGDVD